MSVLGIIPARKGSKRLPNKNRAKFGKKPLISHSIDYALDNKNIIDRVVVSTNCPIIKEIAENSGVEVIDRPEQISGDHTPTSAVLKHVIDTIDSNFEAVVLLQPTNPLRPTELLNEAMQLFRTNHLDSLFTVSKSSRKYGKIASSQFKPVNYKYGQRSQDLESLYYENGLLYITKPHLLKQGIIFNEMSFPLVVSHKFAEVDIDTYDDLLYAEYLLSIE